MFKNVKKMNDDILKLEIELKYQQKKSHENLLELQLQNKTLNNQVDALLDYLYKNNILCVLERIDTRMKDVAVCGHVP